MIVRVRSTRGDGVIELDTFAAAFGGRESFAFWVGPDRPPRWAPFARFTLDDTEPIEATHEAFAREFDAWIAAGMPPTSR